MIEKGVAIDIQGFRGNASEFILKEIAAVFQTGQTIHFLIKPPYDYLKLSKNARKTAAWLTKYHHRLYWNDGQISFSSARKFLQTNLKDVHIVSKGSEKKKFLEEFLSRTVEDMEECACPSLSTMDDYLYADCGFHNNIGNCALKNAIILLQFYKKITK